MWHARILTIIYMGICEITASAQIPKDVIPQDSTIRTGCLENGLTYYVKHHGGMKQHANFYIVQKVGAIQENDNQQGLAHFLEHMCFKGTEHFRGNSLISYCESLGMQFGTDLNATTRVDETFYQLCNVPVRRQSTIDSCLLILRDWGNALLLQPQAIDEERSVIQEEWKLRTRASNLLIERNLSSLFPNSKYGRRTRLGSMDIVRSFSPKALMDYYHTWYHPSNQAVIIVGDIDPDEMVAAIRQQFGALRNPVGVRPVVAEPVPDNDQPIIIIDHDKELKLGYVKLFIKRGAVADSVRYSVSGLVDDYATQAFCAMLNDRLAQCARQGDCPFVKATMKEGNYVYASVRKALELSVVPKDIRSTAEALRRAVAEVLRASKDGFSLEEAAMFKHSADEALGQSVTAVEVFEACKDHFLHGGALPSSVFVGQTLRRFSSTQLQAMAQERLRQLFSCSGKNMVIVNFNREEAGQQEATAQELLAAVASAEELRLGSYKPATHDGQLLINLPAAGNIIKESRNETLGYTEWQLSNGARVILKKTDMLNQPVILRAEGKGGSARFGRDDLPQVKLFNNAIGISGLGNLSAVQLAQYLADRQLQISMGMDNRYTGISGKAPILQLEPLLQLTHLYLTAIKPDLPSFNMLKQQLKAMVESNHNNVEAVMADSINATLYGHHPWMEAISETDIDKADYNRILQMAHFCTADMRDWTFYLTGNLDEDVVYQLVCRYLASVPTEKVGRRTGRSAVLAQGKVKNIFIRPMKVPNSRAYVMWHNERIVYSPENVIKMDMAGQLLSEALLGKVRLKMQAAYTCNAKGEASLGMDEPIFTLTVMCPMTPGRETEVMKAINETVDDMTRQIDESILNKVKAQMQKRFAAGTQGNGYWDDVVYKYVHYGVDSRADYSLIISALTPKYMQQFMKEFMKHVGKVTVVMLPEDLGKDLFHRMKDLAFVRKNIKTPMKRMAN